MVKTKKVSRFQPNRLWTMIALSSVVLIAAACGPAAAPGANPGAPTVELQAPLPTAMPQPTDTSSIPVTADNCTLLSKDEVGKVLAEDVVDARQPSTDGSLCVYQTQNLILELTFLHKFGGSGNSVQYMKDVRSNGIGDSPVDVAGLGDEAFYHGSSKYRLLLVRKGETVYGFGVRYAAAQAVL